MSYYTKKHKYYCGIDLHAKTMYLCVMDADGEILMHRNMKTYRSLFLRYIDKFREDVCVTCECMHCWYWLADVCKDENIPFVLGHALEMKLIHGSKSKNDRVDSMRIATLLRNHTLPMAYVYPREMRSSRDLLRRRIHFVRKNADLQAHIQNTNHQYNLPDIEKSMQHKSNRIGVSDRFDDTSARKSIEVDIMTINHYDDLITGLDLFIEQTVKVQQPNEFNILKTIRGVGRILGMTMLYEIHDINRFARVQDFLSYARLVKGTCESAGKRKGTKGGKMGNAYLKWAFSEAAVTFSRHNPETAALKQKLERKHGKAKTLSIIATKIARAVYYMLKRQKAFDMNMYLKT